MAAFKNKDNGTWYVQFRYTDWKGERQQKLKRGFATKREALEWEREFLMEKQADVRLAQYETGSRTPKADLTAALAIAERVGHESIDITYRYAHLFPTRQVEMADKLDSLKNEKGV